MKTPQKKTKIIHIIIKALKKSIASVNELNEAFKQVAALSEEEDDNENENTDIG